MTFRKIVHTCGTILVLFSIVFLISKISCNLQSIVHLTFGLREIIGLVTAVMVMSVNLVVFAYAWSLLLRGGKIFLPLRKAYIIIGCSQIAKYLPGNFFQYAGRVTLGQKAGIPAEAILLSTGVEVMLVAATAFMIAAAGLLFDRSTLLSIFDGYNVRLGLIVLLSAIIGLSVMAAVLPRFRVWLLSRLAYLHLGRVSASMLLYLVMFVIYGVIISELLRTFWIVETALQWYQFTWGFALAWVLGFIVPGAPAGIGIRETVLVGLYGAPLGEGVAVGLAAVLRIVTSLGELLTFGLAYWLSKKEKDETFDESSMRGRDT